MSPFSGVKPGVLFFSIIVNSKSGKYQNVENKVFFETQSFHLLWTHGGPFIQYPGSKVCELSILENTNHLF